MQPIDKIVALKTRLHRNPTIAEIRNELDQLEIMQIQKDFGSYLGVLRYLDSNTPTIITNGELYEARLARRYKTLCAKKEQIQGFFRHVIDLKDLFERAGNPQSLKFLVQPDTHVKYMDRAAVGAFLKFMAFYQPHGHIILGDFADCEGVAHWEPDSLKPRRLVPEMKIGRQLLEQIEQASPQCTTRIFLEGNHEYWISMALAKMPELFEDLEDLGIEISLSTLLGLDKFGYDLFPLNHLVQIGKAHFTHGIYTTTHHAKKHLDVFKGNIYYGHLHDTQEHNQTSLDGNLEASSLGCLCRLDAHFLKGKPNNWVHGFGVFEFFPDGNYTKIRPNILNGKFSYNGIVFDGN